MLDFCWGFLSIEHPSAHKDSNAIHKLLKLTQVSIDKHTDISPQTVRPTYGRRSDVIRSDIFSSADVVGPVDNMFEDEFETPTVSVIFHSNCLKIKQTSLDL